MKLPLTGWTFMIHSWTFLKYASGTPTARKAPDLSTLSPAVDVRRWQLNNPVQSKFHVKFVIYADVIYLRAIGWYQFTQRSSAAQKQMP